MLPDAEVLVIQALMAQPELAPLGGRIYSVMPKDMAFPLVRVTRYGGDPLHPGGPYWIDQPVLAVHLWAQGSHAEARQLGELLRACCAQRLVGAWAQGVVASAAVSSLVSDPDPTFTPPKPRTRFTASLRTHPTEPASLARKELANARP